ncbi:MAG: hypothetical protein M5U12_29305 [Verrucomicrobia bacterium]|nr:hypothetical protein [Verrucomicrobiota bacterium]
MNSAINPHQRPATSRTARFAVPAIVAWAMAGLTGTAVSANPIYVSAFASVTRPASGPLTQDTGQLIGQTDTTAAVSFTGAGQNSSVMVRAEMGDLGVRVFAGSAGFTAGATAVGIARFSDDLLITSETLSVGTPVRIQFSMNLEGTTFFDSFSSLPANTGLDSSIFLTGQVSGWGARTYHELHRYGRAVSVTGDPTFTVDSTVGATLTLVGTLDINVRSDFQSGANSGLSDYLNSAKFFAAADRSDVALVSASGHDYSAIPEPEHYALAVGGALALFALWRRCGDGAGERPGVPSAQRSSRI